MNWQNCIWTFAVALILVIFVWYFLMPHLVLLGWVIVAILIIAFLLWLFYRIFVRVQI